MIFPSLPFHGIPPHAPPHPFSADLSWQPIIRQSYISRFLPLKATTFLRWFPGFVTPGPVLLTSAVVRRLRSASFVFVVVSLLISGHYSPISLLFHSSPSPANRRPQQYKPHFLRPWYFTPPFFFLPSLPLFFNTACTNCILPLVFPIPLYPPC